MKHHNDLINGDHLYHKQQYKSHLKAFLPSIRNKDNIYKELLDTVLKNNEFVAFLMSDYYFEKYIIQINDNFKKIEEELIKYISDNNFSDETKNYFFHHKPFLEKRIRELLSQTNSTININFEHPKHDPNLWNEKCFELFKYLFDNYYNGSKRQLTNIWYYLKEYNSQQYILKATKEKYKEFIMNYNVKITNTDKAFDKYKEKDYPTMNEHRQNFEDNIK